MDWDGGGTRLDAAGIAAGPVFRSIRMCGAMASTSLGVGSVNAILDHCMPLANLDDAPDQSSRSLVRGMATSTFQAGADFRDIKKQGG